MTTGSAARKRREHNAPRLAPPEASQASDDRDPVGQTLAWLKDYKPADIGVKTWKTIRPFVVGATTSLATEHGISREALPKYVRVLRKIAEHQLQARCSLHLETTLDPYTINQFAQALSKSDPDNAGTYRSHLRFVGERVNPNAAWERTPSVSHRAVPVPYSSEDITTLAAQIAKNTPARRRGGEALMTLGLGAGLDGRWAAKVRKPDVVHDEDGFSIRVQGRLVPVLHAYGESLAVLLDATDDDGLLVGGRALGKNAASAIASRLVLDAQCPRLHAGRLRSTWIVTHLTMGTRLRELAAAAGTQGITTFSDLLEFVPPLSEDLIEAHRKAAEMLRGAR